MKKIIYLLAALLSIGCYSCNCQTKAKDKNAAPEMIRTEIPVRPDGQKDVVGFRTAPMDSVRVGFIGLGMRGPGAVYR